MCPLGMSIFVDVLTTMSARRRVRVQRGYSFLLGFSPQKTFAHTTLMKHSNGHHHSNLPTVYSACTKSNVHTKSTSDLLCALPISANSDPRQVGSSGRTSGACPCRRCSLSVPLLVRTLMVRAALSPRLITFFFHRPFFFEIYCICY